MNVIITLDSFYVRLIQQGIMRIIPRRYVPSSFSLESDYVYILEKGTKRFALICKVGRFIDADKEQNLWSVYGRDMSVKRSWIASVIHAGDSIKLWVLKSAVLVVKPVRFDSVFDIKEPPHNCRFVNITPDEIVRKFHVSFSPLWERIEVIEKAVQ